jgi:UDP-N-acetylmuramate dehydrogenase
MKQMNISKNVPLSAYSTMGLGGPAAHLTEVHDRAELVEALTWAKQQQLPVTMIGGGSNIIWGDQGFAGLVVVNKMPGYDVLQVDEINYSVTVGAGENWDSVVARTVEAELTGIEALSLIPGTAGGTPVQNVGAYGQEISTVLTIVEAYDSLQGGFVFLTGADCGFSYRNSRFKSADRGRFFITNIKLQLKKAAPRPPFYPAVQAYFKENGIASATPAQLREAVIAIRTAKLPDPAVVRNTGSFFGNPVVPREQFASLIQKFSNLPNWPMSNGTVKLSAAWLIEQTGFKDYHDEETGMATWPAQPLVLVNEKARTTADLLAFKAKIVNAVQTKFGITLVQEPEMLS